MYSYHRMIKQKKRWQSVLTALGDLILFIFPVISNKLTFHLVKFLSTIPCFTNQLIITHVISGILTLLYIIYLYYRLRTIYQISNDKRDVYRKLIMDQVQSVTSNKYHMLCKEIHHGNFQGKDLLLYDAHAVINNTLFHIKQLIASITGVSLENISVNFIYKYYGNNEHWQTIDGSSSCSIGTLDHIVEESESMYHYLYKNNREYIFCNDKATADWHLYRPSMRDGESKDTWGSIYCRRILCSLHQNRFVDGILAISTYNEKFVPSKNPKEVREVEGLINEAINAFIEPVKAEMAALYIRHEYIKEQQCIAIEKLVSSGFIEIQKNRYIKSGKRIIAYKNPKMMSEENRLHLIQTVLPEFKSVYNNSHPGYFLFDSSIDYKTKSALEDFENFNQYTK